MKKSFITMALMLLVMAAQAQTAFKVHNNGQISFQSSTTTCGMQISPLGALSVEPNIATAYEPITLAKARHLLVKSWTVKLDGIVTIPTLHSFYVLGNGNVFAYGNYLTFSPNDNKEKGHYPIEGASDLVSEMKGYYLDSNEFEGVTPEDFENNANITPEALEGLLKDLEKDKIVGMYAEELEEVLPEAVRHNPEGGAAINYNAIVPVLIEAFKEQQARIDQLEAILKENGLMKK